MKDKELHCHYSGLPSPSAYTDDYIDYDGMGNQGRFPKINGPNKTFRLTRLIRALKAWGNTKQKK
tara:strand:+ start:767 stop:961 length:195 start_codon:yes stop_codon:yes gene_type:complete